ncbi:DUF664 domain-containing protein [Actinocrinis sp.]|uniref:mycothiol transferase n=1 Tax=Actinocrinis sp. TaxID=1920516 RepID=UPI002D4373AF|nr:DUF664 domain-containing protein [Actinocrinis sp.]HZP54226.1 DUF664 domain-containing protein [Actinocrinis sp.]
MIDEFAKAHLHKVLRRYRNALLRKLDGLSEYDIRRPLTATGTNLLGLVKHVATAEAWYFGEVFDRPSPERLPRWQDHDGGVRHAGHTDILREGLDGRTGSFAEYERPIDEEARAAYCAKIEQAAGAATLGNA